MCRLGNQDRPHSRALSGADSARLRGSRSKPKGRVSGRARTPLRAAVVGTRCLVHYRSSCSSDSLTLSFWSSLCRWPESKLKNGYSTCAVRSASSSTRQKSCWNNTRRCDCARRSFRLPTACCRLCENRSSNRVHSRRVRRPGGPLPLGRSHPIPEPGHSLTGAVRNRLPGTR